MGSIVPHCFEAYCFAHLLETTDKFDKCPYTKREYPFAFQYWCLPVMLANKEVVTVFRSFYADAFKKSTSSLRYMQHFNDFLPFLDGKDLVKKFFARFSIFLVAFNRFDTLESMFAKYDMDCMCVTEFFNGIKGVMPFVKDDHFKEILKFLASNKIVIFETQNNFFHYLIDQKDDSFVEYLLDTFNCGVLLLHYNKAGFLPLHYSYNSDDTTIGAFYRETVLPANILSQDMIFFKNGMSYTIPEFVELPMLGIDAETMAEHHKKIRQRFIRPRKIKKYLKRFFFKNSITARQLFQEIPHVSLLHSIGEGKTVFSFIFDTKDPEKIEDFLKHVKYHDCRYLSHLDRTYNLVKHQISEIEDVVDDYHAVLRILISRGYLVPELVERCLQLLLRASASSEVIADVIEVIHSEHITLSLLDMLVSEGFTQWKCVAGRMRFPPRSDLFNYEQQYKDVFFFSCEHLIFDIVSVISLAMPLIGMMPHGEDNLWDMYYAKSCFRNAKDADPTVLQRFEMLFAANKWKNTEELDEMERNIESLSEKDLETYFMHCKYMPLSVEDDTIIFGLRAGISPDILGVHFESRPYSVVFQWFLDCKRSDCLLHYLVNTKYVPEKNVVQEAMERGVHPEMLADLIESGMLQIAPASFEELHRAIVMERVSYVDVFLRKAPELMVMTNSEGFTPQELAEKIENPQIKSLFKTKPKVAPSQLAKFDKKNLKKGLAIGDYGFINEALMCGAKMPRHTWVHLIDGSSSLDIAKLLRKFNIPLNRNKGEHPLHVAAGHGDIQMIKYMVEDLGVSPFVKDRDDYTPRAHAKANRHHEAKELLKELQRKYRHRARKRNK
ncbi:hypothetical protein PCE1_002690 [Barthelona sp. PCE]